MPAPDAAGSPPPARRKPAPRASPAWGRRLPVFLLALAALLPVAGGQLLSDYTFLQLNLMLVFAVAVLGLNLLTGCNGQISLGHGAFLCLGAYVAAILMARCGWPYWATVPAAALACFVAGYLFGLPALRLEGPYLALATFALAIAAPQILKYRHIEALTGGVEGLLLPRVEAPLGLPLTPDQWLYLLILAVAAALFWAARNLIDSRAGRALAAIRDQPIAAAAVGVDLARYKAVTFGISALYTGVAGALYALVSQGAAPGSFRFELSITLMVGMVVGGVGSLAGAAFGGVFVQVIEKYADAVARQLGASLNLPIDIEPWAIYGVALIALVYLMPTGIAGGLARLAAWARRLVSAQDGA